MGKILVVEDEQDLAFQVRDWLSREHHLIEVVHNGQDALDRLRVYKYDAIILDWMLPGMAGVDVCKEFRGKQKGKTPILMLTARAGIDDKEEGLDAGADDYLPKPFQLRELSARVRALLRRASGATSNTMEVRNIIVDPAARKVTRDGQEVRLEPKEFALLEFLVRNPNTVFSTEALITRVWESESLVSPDAIRTYIKGLRKKLDTEGQPSIIGTVHGVGYRLDE